MNLNKKTGWAIICSSISLSSACIWATPISVSTDVLNNGSASIGNLPDGTHNANGVDYVKFVALAASMPVQYNSAGATIDVSQYVADSGAERGAVQTIYVNGYSTSSPPATGNLYFRGETDQYNPGFGAHANWLVTLDLNIIRANKFGGSTLPITLAGRFGTWGGIGDNTAAAGVIQGTVFLDGTRIDSMGETIANPTPVSQSFNLTLPSTGHYLTFGIFNGNDSDPSGNSTLWDDGLFESVTMDVPEPASIGLLSLGAFGLLARRRRNDSGIPNLSF